MNLEKPPVIIAYKGFDKDLKCRGYSFEIGKEHVHNGKVKACESGFHSCEYPLDVFGYYNPADSRFCLVEVSGDISRHAGDSKIASANLTIKAELKIPELVTSAINFILSNIKKDNKKSAHKTEEKSHASNTGDYSAASNTGDCSAASNTGNYSAASNTGNQSAASNTGNYSAASNTGNRSAASVTGKNSVAMAIGYQSKALASAGNAIVLCYRDHNFNLIHIKAGIAGKDIKADTWYVLNSSGEFEEVAK
jgi:hypothetical protein